MADIVAVRVRISGHVQGVWFRDWTVNAARDLSLEGWVRNRQDGSVEAVFCGPARQVERMIVACHEGPPAADVEDVVREPAAPSEYEGRGFEKRPTA